MDLLPNNKDNDGISKLLEVPKFVFGTGEIVATAVFNTIIDCVMIDQVSAMCFDTTALNTGHCAGAKVLLEKKLGKSLLYMAYKYLIIELVL